MNARITTPNISESDSSSSADARVQRSRARIIQASIDLIAEEGAGSLTVDAIAERSGVAKSTLYRHWTSIDALILDVFRAAVPPVLETDADASFEEALRAQVALVGDTLTDPKWIRLLPDLLALRQQYPEIGELADQDRAEKQAALADILESGAAQGFLPPQLDIVTVAATLLGPMVMCALFGEPERIQEVGAFTVDRFLDSYRH